MNAQDSYFDGGAFDLFFHRLGAVLLTVVTAGLAYPWAVCMLKRWEADHTVINGRRLRFYGTGGQLFGQYIKWFLLSFVTAGIYLFWLTVKSRQWVVAHTEFYGSGYVGGEAPGGSAQAPGEFSLKSTDLIYAAGMIAYTKHFRFTGGASDALERQLFEVAERAVAQDREVVMAFVGLSDYRDPYDNGGPCGCAMSLRQFVICSRTDYQAIPLQDIVRFSVQDGQPIGTLVMEYKNGSASFGIDPARLDDLLYVCNTSLKSCMAEMVTQ